VQLTVDKIKDSRLPDSKRWNFFENADIRMRQCQRTAFQTQAVTKDLHSITSSARSEDREGAHGLTVPDTVTKMPRKRNAKSDHRRLSRRTKPDPGAHKDAAGINLGNGSISLLCIGSPIVCLPWLGTKSHRRRFGAMAPHVTGACQSNGAGRHAMNSTVIKRSIIVAGHKTSVSLEDGFWNALKQIAGGRDATVSDLVAIIDADRQHANLSSAIRLFVLGFYRDQVFAPEAEHWRQSGRENGLLVLP
jgi:predicted DNA-binding ribbon-helix-helix protein